MLNDSIVRGRTSNILYRLSVDSDQLSYPSQVEPKRFQFHKINTTSIKEMIISIIDEKKRIVYFDDIPVSINLIFKEM